MEKYFILHIQHLNDGSSISVTDETTDMNIALSKYHSMMASDMVSDNLEGSLVYITTGDGRPIVNNTWHR